MYDIQPKYNNYNRSSSIQMISPTNNQALNKQTFNLKISDIKFSIISKRYHKKHKSNHNQAIQNKMQHSSSTISRSSNGVSRNSFIPKNNIKCQSHSQIEKGQRFDFTPLDPVQASYLKFPGRKLKSLKPRSYFQVANENMATVYNRLKTNNTCTSMQDGQIKKSTFKSKSCILNVHPSDKNILINNNNNRHNNSNNKQQQKQEFTTYKDIRIDHFSKALPKSQYTSLLKPKQPTIDQRYRF